MPEEEPVAQRSHLYTTAAGVWRHWQDRHLTSAVFHAALGTGNARFTQLDRSRQPASETETLQLIYFDRSRDLFQSERIGPDDLHTPEMLITQGTTFWAWTQSVLRTNQGDASQSQVGDEAKQSLSPRSILEGFVLVQEGRAELAGRPCLVSRATVRQSQWHDGGEETLEPFGMAVGAAVFLIYIDPQDKVVLRVEKWFEDQLAECVEWLSLLTDCRLPPGVFSRRLNRPQGR